MSLKQPLHLRHLRWPSGRESLFWAKSLLLGGVIPVWLALCLAVAPGTGKGVPLETGEVAGIPVRGVQLASLTSLFDSHGYDLNDVAEGRRDVPPIFVRSLPPDWRAMKAKKRKRAFVKTVLPLILKANARIRAERVRLLDLIAAADGDLSGLPEARRRDIERLAKRYGTDPDDFDTLKRRVDIVPVSLALAQAANESAWGTSRFAREGNALFGQWTWDTEDGIAPKDPQADKGDYAVRAFDSLGHSVAAYMTNLNTHPAYADFRERRARLRKAGKPLSGVSLAGGLLKYSQRGADYVAEIREMIRYNDFQGLEQARLAIVPLG